MGHLKSYQSNPSPDPGSTVTRMSVPQQPVVITRVNNVLTLSGPDNAPLDPQLIRRLTHDLRYEHMEAVAGPARRDPITGQKLFFQTKEYKLYRVENGKVVVLSGYLARMVNRLRKLNCPASLVNASPTRKRPNCYTPQWDLLAGKIDFRPRQEECLRTIARVPCGIIKAVTGFGKTTLIGAAAQLFPEARIDVITKSVDVAERIARSLRRFVPKVGKIGDGWKDRQRVTVITAGSLQHADGDADFMFADEVHQLATVNFSTALASRYRNSRNFGLSATPYARMDNAHQVLEPLFGPMVFELTYQQAVELGLVVPVRVRWLPMRLRTNPAERFTNRVARKRNGIWTNYERNQIIATAVGEYPANTQVLILVETIEHAVHLGAQLPDFTLMYGSMTPTDAAYYKKHKLLPEDYSPLTFEQKHDMRAAFETGALKKVIATDVWATGVDFEQLSVLVRADDRDSDIVDVQGPGRVSRVYTAPDGTRKDYGEVIDCMDTFDPTFYRKSLGRRNSYKELGWEQNWHDAQRSWRGSGDQGSGA
jgi:superfamily II DNA or RNA helicase